ncbi:MAG: hypothetical protein ACRD0O_19450 [Acidimicrobiia bacterium]
MSPGGGSGGNSGGGGGGNRRRRPAQGRAGTGQSPAPNKASSGGRPSSGGRSNPARRRTSDVDFWGRPGDVPPPVTRIRPTGDPAALPRSLGDPPLGPNPAAAAHHLAVIYEEAVRAGTALAAASGLLDEQDEDLES